ncbi:chromosomal replication initiator protein DnaA [Hoeflea phototrophica DFL-43]|uniref:Chromosomal replication initiator protein DnaA n=1 Tax=Hoeflea phototrophica (strain DSM 17068 / NCIMB 14078 / DFL-43) TaxID=411684 RepID=A9CWQ0_HOEPD|nr:chromosomal replication initiator protein DnaA [Hoeflea phototrophica]EDQ35551.1 chromosomal replication initiator protein DnaA [Hoeflea phototrophica DFL-43]
MKKTNDVFERVMARLKAQVGQEIFTSWFGRLKLQSASKSVVRLSVPTAFLKSWINNKYLDQISALYREEAPDVLKIEIVVRSATRSTAVSSAPDAASLPNASQATPGASASRKEQHVTVKGAGAKFGAFNKGPQAANAVIGSPLDPQCTFDSYVEGSSNRVALAAARTIAEAGTGAVRFNPLFIHSNVGLGKTHLLQAIAAAASSHSRNPRVVYLTAEYFMWRFATAIRDNDALSFKESLRNIDLLVIDDMQFLQGKSIQHEFCHLLNMLLDSARQVVVAADRAPWELESLDPRVRSRLQGGVAIEIEAPDYEMRLEILRKRLAIAQMEDATLDIDETILAHVAQNITSSGRELEGAFNQLLFRRSFEPNLSIERVDELLGHLVNAGEPKRVRIEDIQRVVSRHYNVTRQELVSDRRTRVIVKPRQIAMYLAKTMTPRSFPEIGRRFGGRDHTTVLHAVRKIEELINGDTKLGHEIELLKRLIIE